MARKDESILNQLVECLWWVSDLVSAAAFVCSGNILPAINFGDMAANSVPKGLYQVVPIVVLVL